MNSEREIKAIQGNAKGRGLIIVRLVSEETQRTKGEMQLHTKEGLSTIIEAPTHCWTLFGLDKMTLAVSEQSS